MATVTSDTNSSQVSFVVNQIGDTAGVVWHTIHDQGPMSLAKLVRTVSAPRDLVHQAVGWLAREEKVRIDEVRRSRVVSLIED